MADKHSLSLPCHILVTDDNKANLKLLSHLLDDMGHHVTEAESGKQALQLCQQQRFDMVFMDIRMTEMDGIETTRRIRLLNSHNARIPVIAVTAHAMPDQKQHFLLSGLDDYLSKPISEEQLKKIINRWQHQMPQTKDNWPDCIDRELSLKLSNGKKDLAAEMLALLLDDLPGTRIAIDQAFNQQDLAQALELVHRLHGACCYCGVPTLKEACKIVEIQLKEEPVTLKRRDVTALNQAIDDLLIWKNNCSIEELFS
jgi:two-component system sensor histidine kinase BarA